MSDYTYTALDTETCGLKNNPKTGRNEIIELALLPLDNSLLSLTTCLKDKGVTVLFNRLKELTKTERFLPAIAIDPRATEVHGIVRKDLAGCRHTKEVSLPEDLKIMFAHSAAYDHRALGKPEIQVICTLRLAKKIDKNRSLGADNFKLVTLIKHFYGKEGEKLVQHAHAAETDTILVVLLLLKLLNYMPNVTNLEELSSAYTLLMR